jgi:hypothetical protein
VATGYRAASGCTPSHPHHFRGKDFRHVPHLLGGSLARSSAVSLILQNIEDVTPPDRRSIPRARSPINTSSPIADQYLEKAMDVQPRPIPQ